MLSAQAQAFKIKRKWLRTMLQLSLQALLLRKNCVQLRYARRQRLQCLSSYIRLCALILVHATAASIALSTDQIVWCSTLSSFSCLLVQCKLSTTVLNLDSALTLYMLINFPLYNDVQAVPSMTTQLRSAAFTTTANYYYCYHF
jgi:hypothetical protein